ncbi:MAG: hypothetical protein IPL57_12385 [Rubrivivax sp.]|nr:hypothetical protein [Rubrivivax sp.]
MLAWWWELAPLFVVRWLALRYCERVPFDREGNARVAAVARPDVLVRVPPNAELTGHCPKGTESDH